MAKEEEQEQFSLDDTLDEVYEELNKPEEPNEDEPETKETGGDRGTSEEGEGKTGSGEGEESGEDAGEEEPAEGESEETSGEEESSESEEQGEDSTEGEEGELEDSLKLPPTSWKAENKERYDKLPAWAKQQVHQREQEMQDGVEKLKQQTSFGYQMEKVVQPYRAFLNQSGQQPEAVMENALNLAYSLVNSDPKQRGEILKNIGQQYGADLSVFSEENEEGGYKTDPRLLQEIQSLRQHVYGQNQAAQEQQQGQAVSAIQEFQSATDENGKPKYPHFDRVRELMASFIESGRATTLEQAYDQAVWADPDTRRVLQTEQQRQEQAKREAEAKKKAEKARKANKVNVRKSGEHESSSEKPPGTLDETLDEVYERIANS